MSEGCPSPKVCGCRATEAFDDLAIPPGECPQTAASRPRHPPIDLDLAEQCADLKAERDNLIEELSRAMCEKTVAEENFREAMTLTDRLIAVADELRWELRKRTPDATQSISLALGYLEAALREEGAHAEVRLPSILLMEYLRKTDGMRSGNLHVITEHLTVRAYGETL